MSKIKIDRALRKGGKISAKAIAIYSNKLKEQLISSTEKAEKPQVEIFLNWNEKRKAQEIALVLSGEHRAEPYSYWQKDPKEWKTWGRLILGPEDAALLLEKLQEVLKYCRRRPGAAEVSLRDFCFHIVDLSDRYQLLFEALPPNRPYAVLGMTRMKKNILREEEQAQKALERLKKCRKSCR